MKLFVSAASSRACWDAVFTCAVGGSSAVEVAHELVVRDARLRRDGDLVESTALPEELLGGGEIEARQRGAADRRDRSEPDEPRDPKPLRRALRLDADRLAEPEILLVRRRLVDDELAVPSARRPGRA